MATVTYDNVTCIYPGAERPSISDLNLDIADGEFLVLVGPSGSGKSTALRMLAGLEEVTDGAIRIGEKNVTHMQPRDRDVAMVFQNYALYPHMSVRDNMGFALKIAGVSTDERNKRVEEAAKILDIVPYLDRKPKALSGGQRQRVAMGRAIVRSPQVFLMDEPLSNLDAKLRVQTRTQISSLTRQLGVTTVYVTHDQVEAMTMGDRVAVLKDGLLMQVDTPRNLYDRPANEFVAGFIGSPSMNLMRADVVDGSLAFGNSAIRLTGEQAEALQGTRVTVGIRPEAMQLGREGQGAAITVDLVEELGADAYVYGRLAAEDSNLETVGAVDVEEGEEVAGSELVLRIDGRATPPKVGDTLWVAPHLEQLHLFDSSTGARLPDAAPVSATR